MILAIIAIVVISIFCLFFASSVDTYLIAIAVIMAAAIMRQGHEGDRR